MTCRTEKGGDGIAIPSPTLICVCTFHGDKYQQHPGLDRVHTPYDFEVGDEIIAASYAPFRTFLG